MTGMLHLPAEFFELERFIFRGNVADGGDGALDDENIRAGFLRDRSEFRRPLRNGTDRRGRAAVFDLPDARRDQIFLHRFLVNFLEQPGDLRFVGFDNFLENFLRVFVARLDAFEIQNGQAAELAHLDGEAHIDHAIHRAGQDRDLEIERFRVSPRQTPGDVDFVRIDRDPARDQRDFVEPVGHARFSISANPHSHD